MTDIILILSLVALGIWGYVCVRGLTNLLSGPKK